MRKKNLKNLFWTVIETISTTLIFQFYFVLLQKFEMHLSFYFKIIFLYYKNAKKAFIVLSRK